MQDMLIADAEVDSWFGINALLRQYALRASFANSLAMARRLIEENAPAFLFIDAQLSETGTSSFIHFVKSSYPRTKVICIKSRLKSTASCITEADMTIERPIGPDAIQNAINGMLFNQRRNQQPGTPTKD